MKQIPLTHGKIAVVDDDDFDRINSMGKWQAHNLKGPWYACITKYINGKKKSFLMHRVILGLQPGEIADHKDRNSLNNQKDNLRRCTPSQNAANRKREIRNTSGFKGVHWNKRDKLWYVYVKKVFSGCFKSKEEAAMVYNRVASQMFGEFACLNPEGDPELPDDGLPDEIADDSDDE